MAPDDSKTDARTEPKPAAAGSTQNPPVNVRVGCKTMDLNRLRPHAIRPESIRPHASSTGTPPLQTGGHRPSLDGSK